VISTDLEVQLPIFQGPLDLLLQLIERAELEITALSLAQVTDQYLEYLRRVPEHELADLAAFLVIAARLLQIKSEALLPRPPQREPGEEDPGDALARQLIAYKRYKEVAQLLEKRQALGLHTYLRIAPPPAVEPKLDLSGIDLQVLRQAYQEALRQSHQPPSLEQVVAPPKIRIRDQIVAILRQIKRQGRTSFWRLITGTRSRVEIIVSFLAMLELVKLRKIRVEQREPFGDIEISPGEDWQEDQLADFELEFEE
jgi:segregation and condensation protein A